MQQYYPFLNSERARLKSLDIKLDELSKNPLYTSSVDNAALDLIGESIEPGDRDSAIVEFTLSKILLAIIDNKSASESYAEIKSLEYRESLEKESLTFLIKIAREDFDMRMKTEDSLRLHFIDFLKYKPDFLKLSQMNIRKGYVQISKSQFSWVLKGAIKIQIIEGIPKSQKFPDSLIHIANKVRGKAVREKKRYEERPKISSLKEDALPPCIQDIIKSLGEGKANHNAHFVLVSFLNGLNLEESAVLDVFRRSPKFKERIAAYQIKFAKERGYTCPSCKSIKGYGLCTGDCPRGHPISNYFLFLKMPKKAKKNG
jgi:DNA primase large subunit